MTLRTVLCNNRGASDRWLQTHASYPGAALPLDGAVPLRRALFIPANYISEDQLPAGGIVVNPGTKLIVSSTPATLTRDAAATVDITADVDEFELQSPTSPTIAGDITTGVKNRTIWADSAGPKTLLRLELSNTTGSDIYAQLFPVDSPAEGRVPLQVWTVPASTSILVDLGGNAGRSPFSQDADGTQHDACVIVFSTTQWTKTIVGANSGTIKGYYK